MKMFRVDVSRSNINIIHNNLNKIKPHELIRTFSHERTHFNEWTLPYKALLIKWVEPPVQGVIGQRTVTPGDGMMISQI